MTEKINDILFRPSSLIKFTKTKLILVFLYLIILTIFASIVPTIETVKFSGFGLGDRQLIEESYNIKFSDVQNYPDCKVSNFELSCKEENDMLEVTRVLNVFTIVFDVENKMELKENKFYLKFTKHNVKLTDNRMSYLSFEYEELPKSWQEFDLEAIKNSKYPEHELYKLFVGGINEINAKLKPYQILSKFVVMYFVLSFEILLYSLLFYLIVNKNTHKFKEVFKVGVFAYTLPIIIGLFASLAGLPGIGSMWLSLLTIIYMYIALVPKTEEIDE